MTQLYKRAINTWGVLPQINLCMEECAELIQACSKFTRSYGKKIIDQQIITNLCEEIADVEIMIAQVKLIIDNDHLIENFKQQKITNLKERLDV